MVGYSFKGRFVPKIAGRTKTQTMRAVGKKRHAKKGELITMTTGDRFHPVKFGAARAIIVAPVTLDFEGRHAFWIHQGVTNGDAQINIEGAALDVFARSDGFDDWADLESFFRQTYAGAPAWSGIRIFWGDTFASLTPAGASTNG